MTGATARGPTAPGVRRRAVGAARRRVTFAAALWLAAGCVAAPRLVPLPAGQALVDPAAGTVTLTTGELELVVGVSAWRGNPWDLADYVTPLLVRLSSRGPVPLAYDYRGFRLRDDHQFQYTALAPVDVDRILRSRVHDDVRLAAISSPPPILRRRIVPHPAWDDWAWSGYGPYYPYWWPWYGPPPFEDVYLRALPMGDLQPGARVEGFVYFPRLRTDARALVFEFHHRLGDTPQTLTLPFGVERGEARPPSRG